MCFFNNFLNLCRNSSLNASPPEQKGCLKNACTIIGLVGVGAGFLAIFILPGSLGVAGHFAGTPLFMKEITAVLTVPGSIAFIVIGVGTELGIVVVAICIFRSKTDTNNKLEQANIPVQSQSVPSEDYLVLEGKALAIINRLKQALTPRRYCIAYVDRDFGKIKKGTWAVVSMVTEEGQYVPKYTTSAFSDVSDSKLKQNTKEAAEQWAEENLSKKQKVTSF